MYSLQLTRLIDYQDNQGLVDTKEWLSSSGAPEWVFGLDQPFVQLLG